MAKNIEGIVPELEEDPSVFAERLGILYSSTVHEEHKKNYGQFFTPIEVARFMAKFSAIDKRSVKILDPGCGIGILSITLIEQLVSLGSVESIELIAFETDSNIFQFTDKAYLHLSQWLKKRKIAFTFFLCKNDFVLHNSSILLAQDTISENYDIIISNPPYFKLKKNDVRIEATKSVIHGQSNIYSIFLLIAAKLLKEDGELIFITPRSFCSGSYFRLFREIFFSAVDINVIHLFESRKHTFKRDRVLLENIIIVAEKKRAKEDRQILISSSSGVNDLANKIAKFYKWTDLVNLDSYQKILHLPTSDVDSRIMDVFRSWTGSLRNYNLKISTGPVVDFRSVELLRSKKTHQTVPLFWLHNVLPMSLNWPKNTNTSGKPKPQYILNNTNARSRLVPNKNYVLLRRFSSKDDNRRLIAAPYFHEGFNSHDLIGIENHLNYIYHKTSELDKIDVLGISALLNSELFDLYFRTFNGNINVSATELRDFPLPEYKKIQQLGKLVVQKVQNKEEYSIDALLQQVLNLNIEIPHIYG